MLTHLLDTDTCVYAMKLRDHSLTRKLGSLRGALAISDITLFELYYGAQKYAEPELRIAIVEDFASRVAVVAFESPAARIAGSVRHKLQKQGQLIGAYDVLVAAIALTHGLVLVTNNTREFSRVEGLKLENWISPK